MKKEYKISGIDCANCARKLSDKMNQDPTINSVKVDILTDTMVIDSKHQQKAIEKAKKLEPSLQITNQGEKETSLENKKIIYKIIFTIILIIASLFLKDIYKCAIVLIAYIIIGYNVIEHSYKSILRGDIFNEFFLMSVATIAAVFIGKTYEAVIVMLLYTIGEYLQSRAVAKSKQEIKKVLEFQIKNVQKQNIYKWDLVDPTKLKIGDIIKVKAGESIPVDCKLKEKEILINTSALTGESIPRTFYKNDEVLAGMIAEDRVVTLEVIRTYDNSTISKMLELIKNSSENKSQTEKFITKFSKVYTPLIVTIAFILILVLPLIGYTIKDSIYRAIILLVISCPCALVISVPLGYFMTIGQNTKQGVLIKGANFIDALSKADTLVLDKTGTITKGNFVVDKIINNTSKTNEEILKIVASGEKDSTHPIAKSIYNYYLEERSDIANITKFEEVKGRGIKYICEQKEVLVGNIQHLIDNKIEVSNMKTTGTAVYIGIDKEHVMTLVLKDQIKDDSIQAIENLKKDSFQKVIMLTGDKKSVAGEVSKEVGVDKYYSELMPVDKVNKIKEFKAEGKKVCFVGDGINDAGALAISDVGVAMGSIGSDAAIQSADVVINTDSLNTLYESIKTIKKGMAIIRTNILFSIGIKILFILLAILGIANMIGAIFADVGVTILVIINCIRILKKE